MKYTIDITLSDSQIWYLRKLYGKNKNTGVKRLVEIAVKRAVIESSRIELIKTGYAPVEEKAQP